MWPNLSLRGWAFCGALSAALGATVDTRQDRASETRDPCEPLARVQWTSPQELRACFRAIQTGPIDKVRDHLLDVVDKTLDQYHTARYFQKHAPPPFTDDVHVDLDAEFRRMRHTRYRTEFDLHLDLSQTIKGLNHLDTVYFNYCYDQVFMNYIPTPLVLVADNRGKERMYIAPNAFEIASSEFPDQIDVWQNALPGKLKGQLQSLDGAEVLEINDRDPWLAVNANARRSGRYQGFGTRQMAFFASYGTNDAGSWSYDFGDFASMPGPYEDSVSLTIRRVNSSKAETITLPYRSRRYNGVWYDKDSYRENMCLPNVFTNGEDLYQFPFASNSNASTPDKPINSLQQQPPLDPEDRKHHAVSVLVDAAPYSLPSLEALSISPPILQYSSARFYMLTDGKTAVLSLGAFSARSYISLQATLADGIQKVKDLGAKRLIIDVSNNEGGYVCIAHWLHRILLGPRPSTNRGISLDSILRANPMAQRIVKVIAEDGGDPDKTLIYNGHEMAWANGTWMDETTNYLKKPEKRYINGKVVEFSPRLGGQCVPWAYREPPETAAFKPRDIVIVGNGRCSGACAMFSTAMSKRDGVRTVVMGGKKGVPQQYAGSVGGVTMDFAEMRTEILSTGLGESPLALPMFETASLLSFTWKLSLGIKNPNEPEDYQSRAADITVPLTMETVNNPPEVWRQVAKIAW
ncbi:hypothetical protein BXZ70DRAFT_1012287 [Cristinia sonorae]|uniref:Tail specific protease domain-containing protein n=1 Tax=Cristinia sonorae TaxID=1940300 RepID=A0A8K0UFK3_9AGAR|nr:hypothetical protein BXZ70DRAFT_1012287 [Cristinia sonorae]